MDFEFTNEQRAFEETARAFAAERFLPNAAEWNERSIFPADALRAAPPPRSTPGQRTRP